MHPVEPWIVFGGEVFDNKLLSKYFSRNTVQHGSDVDRHDCSLSVRPSAEGSWVGRYRRLDTEY
jgi:hypothetical protein